MTPEVDIEGLGIERLRLAADSDPLQTCAHAAHHSRPPLALFDVAATRRLEQAAAAALPPHTLMQRAGLAVARLAWRWRRTRAPSGSPAGPATTAATASRPRCTCGNGASTPVVTWSGDEADAPADARASLQRAREAGVDFAADAAGHWDLGIDALLGLGSARPLEGPMARMGRRMHAAAAPVLAVDLPSGLDADTGIRVMPALAGDPHA